MAVKKKGLRKVRYKGRHYFWRLEDVQVPATDQGFVDQLQKRRLLHIISADKQFIVHYQQPLPDDAYAELRVEGPLFPRAPGEGIVQVPRWRYDSKPYPTADFVRRLIGWCHEETDGNSDT